MELNIKKGAEIELNIETLAFGGRGVAKANGMVIFVEDTLPGQKVLVRITRKRKGYAEARRIGILQKSVEEDIPRCVHFDECGGCRFQNFNYQAQLKYKFKQVVESLEHIGAIKNPPVLPPVASPEQFYYRNKMEFSFGRQRWLTKQEVGQDEISKSRDFALGLHVRGRFDKILDIDECHLQSRQSSEIVNFVRHFVLESAIPVYSTKDHAGFWRHLVIREGKNTGQTMVNVVTSGVTKFMDDVEKLADLLSDKFPEITTIVHNINRRKAQVAFGDEEIVLFGPGYIQEKIGKYLFQISANSFFQTNSKGAELLFAKALELADFNGNETVFDLYSGAGTISLYIADRVQTVVGFELVEAAVNDALLNSQLNGVKNCQFVPGDLKETLTVNSDSMDKYGHPNTVIIDPPRTGMHADVLQAVLKLQPEKIVYVSCNPTTFARDAKVLCQTDYKLIQVQPVDMFPMTAHIELVSLLKRN